MKLYYINESEGLRHYVRSALGVDAERWNDLFRGIQEWRLELRDRYAIPTDRELHASDLVSGTGRLCWRAEGRWPATAERTCGSPVKREPRCSWAGCAASKTPQRASAAWRSSTSASASPKCMGYERVSLDRLLNRINISAKSTGRHAFLIFGESRERMITQAYRRLRAFNPVPIRYELWEGARGHGTSP